MKNGPRRIVDLSVYDGTKTKTGKHATTDFTISYKVAKLDDENKELTSLGNAVRAKQPVVSSC